MVISFSNNYAFSQLRDEGFVVSFREKERKRTPRNGTQETWCNRGRGQEKEFNVTVHHLAEKIPGLDQFTEFRPMSGFPDRSEWLKAVAAYHGEVPPNGHFYLVTRRGEQVE